MLLKLGLKESIGRIVIKSPFLTSQLVQISSLKHRHIQISKLILSPGNILGINFSLGKKLGRFAQINTIKGHLVHHAVQLLGFHKSQGCTYAVGGIGQLNTAPAGQIRTRSQQRQNSQGSEIQNSFHKFLVVCFSYTDYLTISNSSTSKIRVASGPISPPAPWEP